MLTLLFLLITSTRATIVYISNRFFAGRQPIPWLAMDESTAENSSHELNEQSAEELQYSTTRSSERSQRFGKLKRGDVNDVVTTHNAYENEEVHESKPMVPVKLPVARDASCYKMTHKRRGKCVIFNHEKFDKGYGDVRKGTNIDVERITKTFDNLGFEVKVEKDCGYSELTDAITRLSKENHDDTDCICIFVLTHGQNDGMLFARNACYNTIQLWHPFTPDKCPSLAGKPKLFFIQACRGHDMDNGVKTRSAGNSKTDSTIASYKIPTQADFLIAHSTPDGFCSWRSEEDGTWFVQSLCEVIDEYWKTTDLLSMLTITARDIANNYESVHKICSKNQQKQVPSITSMLIRHLYFNPAITEDVHKEVNDTVLRRINGEASS